MKNKSYFILSRDIFDSAIWRDDPHILKLFIFLIGQARFDDKPKKYPDFEIKRGELVTSLSQIAENNEYMWHGTLQQWSRQKVSRMLKVLTQQDYIKLVSDTYGTHIKVCNYEDYQDQQNYKRTEVERLRYGSVTGVGIYKNGKQGKNGKNGKEGLSTEVKKKHFEYVYIFENELDKLHEKIGVEKTQDMIERLNNYIGQIGEQKANKKYKSHYHVILNWSNKDTSDSKNQTDTGMIELKKFMEAHRDDEC